MRELELKLQRIDDLLDRHSLKALLLRQASSFAWATCGAASTVNVADSQGLASILIAPHGRYILTDNIEAPRLQEEEHLLEQGWEFRVRPWYEQDGLVDELTQGLELGADCEVPGATDLQAEVARMRAALLPEEVERFRMLCKSSAEAMDAAIMMVRPRLSELQIAAVLVREALSRGVEPIVHLIGTDERIFKYRHPLPTEKRLDRYAMLVLCGRKWGLVSSITRLVHFGPIPEEIRSKARAVALVDAHYVSATRPGKKMNEIFQEAADCYRLYGFEDEWQLHHQGGLAGYMPREVIATPSTDDEVTYGQVYAWNPSIAGVKSEDTILVGEQQNEVLTAIPRWPVTKVNLRGQTVERPGILEII
jgi:Xaa-Pro aminopeptidase